VRIATAADVPALSRLINAAYRIEDFFILGDRTTEPEVAALMSEPDCAFLVIDGDPASLIGCVFVRRTGDRGYFGLLAVDPARQGAGYGRQLVAAAENHFRQLGCRHVDLDTVDVRTELPPFYHALGYTETGVVAPFPKPELLKVPAQLVVMTKALG
jgi:GNAT superfamily N-acetyltransferase